ncbi:hypothetical protein D3C71_1427720 [compost metagenome]
MFGRQAFQRGAVYRGDIFAGRGEPVFRALAVLHGDNRHAGQRRHRNRFEQAQAVGTAEHEGAAVQFDQQALLAGRGRGIERLHAHHGHAIPGLMVKLDGIALAQLGDLAVGPLIGPFANAVQLRAHGGVVQPGGGVAVDHRAAHARLRLGAEIGRERQREAGHLTDAILRLGPCRHGLRGGGQQQCQA